MTVKYNYPLPTNYYDICNIDSSCDSNYNYCPCNVKYTYICGELKPDPPRYCDCYSSCKCCKCSKCSKH